MTQEKPLWNPAGMHFSLYSNEIRQQKKKTKDSWIWFVDTFYVYEGRKIMGVSLCDLMSQSCCLKMSIQ